MAAYGIFEMQPQNLLQCGYSTRCSKSILIKFHAKHCYAMLLVHVESECIFTSKWNVMVKSKLNFFSHSNPLFHLNGDNDDNDNDAHSIESHSEK